LIWALIIVSFLGILDAGYLTVSYYAGTDVSCTILKDCDLVLNSQYKEIFGLPLSLYGLAFYLGMFFLSLLYFDTRHKILVPLIFIGGVTGFLVSLALVYLQLFVIGAVCEYCMLSALTSTTLFVLGIILLKKSHSSL
jgi:uncharacterized membrane protein